MNKYTRLFQFSESKKILRHLGIAKGRIAEATVLRIGDINVEGIHDEIIDCDIKKVQNYFEEQAWVEVTNAGTFTFPLPGISFIKVFHVSVYTQMQAHYLLKSNLVCIEKQDRSETILHASDSMEGEHHMLSL